MVAACIPGAELTELTPEGAHRGKVTFKFGPTVAVFRGETRLTYDHPAKRCLIEARGIDQKGASRARARFEVAARGSEITEVSMDGGFEVAGPLEMFASAGGVHVARALLAEFAANIARVIEQRRVHGSDAALEQAPAASGTKIVGRALLDGARNLIGGNAQETNERSHRYDLLSQPSWPRRGTLVPLLGNQTDWGASWAKKCGGLGDAPQELARPWGKGNPALTEGSGGKGHLGPGFQKNRGGFPPPGGEIFLGVFSGENSPRGGGGNYPPPWVGPPPQKKQNGGGFFFRGKKNPPPGFSLHPGGGKNFF